MNFLPLSGADRTEMLRAIGVPSVGALFAAIPTEVRGEPDLRHRSPRSRSGG